MLPDLINSRIKLEKKSVRFLDPLRRPSKIIKVSSSFGHRKSSSTSNLNTFFTLSKIPESILKQYMIASKPKLPLPQPTQLHHFRPRSPEKTIEKSPILTLEMPDPHSNLSKNPRASSYIDNNFPYPCSSTIPNKVSYPGDWDYSSKKILDRYNQGDPDLELLTDLKVHSYPYLNNAPSPELYLPTEDHVTFAWREIDSIGAESREGASIVRVDSNLYLFGGQNRRKHNDVLQFSMNSLECKLLATAHDPAGRCGHTAVGYKNKMVVFGGCSEYSSKFGQRRCDKDIHKLSLKTLKWQLSEGKGQIPKARRNHCSARIGRSMVIYGGIDKLSRTLASCFALNIKNNTWTYLTEGPDMLSHASLTAVYAHTLMDMYNFDIFKVPSSFTPKLQQPGMYLYGGLTTEGKASGDLWVLVINDKPVWKKIETVGKSPVARYHHTTGYIPGYFIVFGGRNDQVYSYTRELVNDIGVLDLESLTWQTVSILGDPPSDRWGHCSCSYGKKFVVFGGMDYKQYMPSKIYYLEVELEEKIII